MCQKFAEQILSILTTYAKGGHYLDVVIIAQSVCISNNHLTFKYMQLKCICQLFLNKVEKCTLEKPQQINQKKDDQPVEKMVKDLNRCFKKRLASKHINCLGKCKLKSQNQMAKIKKDQEYQVLVRSKQLELSGITDRTEVVQPNWKPIRQSLLKLNMCLPLDPAILRRCYPQRNEGVWPPKTCTRMFIAG